MKDLASALDFLIQPFGLLALVVIALAGTFILPRMLRTGLRSRASLSLGLLVASLGLIVLSILAVGSLRKLIRDQTPFKPPPEVKYDIQVSIKGSRLSDTPIAFASASGSINTDCEQAVRTAVTWSAPAGAVIDNASAHWQDLEKVKAASQDVHVSGNTVVAEGTIDGLSRQWFGNCLGGGHGRLVLTGLYRPVATAFELLKTNSELAGDGELTISLPKDLTAYPINAIVTGTGNGLGGTLQFSVVRGESGQLSMGGITTSGVLRIYPTLIPDGKLTLRLIDPRRPNQRSE